MHQLFKWLTVIWAVAFPVVSCSPMLLGSGSLEGGLVGGLASFVIAATFVGPWFVVLVVLWILWAVTKPQVVGVPMISIPAAAPRAPGWTSDGEPIGRWFVRSSAVGGLGVGAQVGLALGRSELLLLDLDGRPGLALPYGTFHVVADGDAARITAAGSELLLLGPASWVTGPELVQAVASRESAAG